MSTSLWGTFMGQMASVNELNAKYNALTYEEQKAMTFFQRLTAYNWTFELFALGALFLVVCSYLIGSSLNTSRAKNLFNPLVQYLKDDLNFTRVGFTTASKKAQTFVSQHSNTWFTTFATGRSAIESITVRGHLISRNNPTAVFMEFLINLLFPALSTETASEYAEIIIKPNGVHVANETSNVNSNAATLVDTNFKFISSIVNKTFMNESRDKNYFLSVTHIAENDSLAKEYVYMGEFNQLNRFMMEYSKGKGEILNKLLKKSVGFLQFISFTDLPSVRPMDEDEWAKSLVPHVVIRTNFVSSKKDVEILKELISCVVEIIDNYTKGLVTKGTVAGTADVIVTNEILKKTKNLRAQELAKIVKEMKMIEMEEQKEKRQEEERERRRQLKKSGEQEKIDKKMKEKRERRQKNKQRTRM
ncbi:uncharacterized protein NDAI_0I00500 [Naumovozyma dairenensis CBS 421]|uniref:Uncharacterized protein n=1 Tax=Naumovozyma dairenensis (strain ATCC 10597 / BCRC 20456 / CBS 421 / NBRC 0211 / NRRL Y-12639) TaxID=1071378 RepID=G0WFQ8_NAUDC|nr:hypothetical protein NDAI_0I00500 [Naumovozyma dairenensis CBS 421]CCD26619.1 hypothetical protein NDAI_0I00500 [Naumovozyma dairenensis CBS 421]